MYKITPSFYQVKAKKAVRRWLTTLCLTVVLWLGVVGQVNAADLTTWALTTSGANATTPSGIAVGLTATNFSAGAGSPAAAPSSSYTTLTTTTAATSASDALTKGNYAQFGLTVQAGYKLDITTADILKVTLGPRGSNGISFVVYYSIDGGAYNAYSATVITASGQVTPSARTFAPSSAITLNGGQQITFRVLFYGANLRMGISNFIPVGTVSACTSPTLTYNLTGATAICSGGSAILGLNNSQTNVSYQLYDGATAVGTAVAGTGSPISFAAVSPTATTTYSVKAKGIGGTYCTTETAVFASTAMVSVMSISAAPVVISPIFVGATSVSGTSIEANGTTIEVFENATLVGTTTVTGGSWSTTVPPLTLGNAVTAQATAAGKCLSAVSNSVTVSIACTAPIFSAQPTDNQSVCLNATAPTLGTVVADQSPSYQWYSVGSKTNTGGTAVITGTGGNTDTYTPVTATAGTYYFYCVATNGACTTASDAVQFTVNAATISLGANPSVVTGSTTANLTYSATTGTQYAIDWDPAAEAAGLVDVALTTLPASPIVLNNIPAAVATYNGTLTVKDAGVCVSVGYPISVNVTAPVSQATDYFRSTGNGDWSAVATWESSINGTSGWHAATLVPGTSASAITILNTHVVAISTAITADDITVAANGRLNVANGGTLTVANGAAANDLILDGYMYCANGGTITATGTIQANSGSTYEEGRNSSGTTIPLPVITWVSGSTCKFSGTYSGSGDINLGASLTTPNIWINCNITDAANGRINLQLSGNSLQNVTIENTGVGSVFAVAGGNGGLVTVASFTQTGGNFIVNRNGSGTRAMTVTGNVTISGGTFDLKSGTSVQAGLLNIGGNFIISSGATVALSGTTSASGSVVTFNGATPQTFSNAGTFSAAIKVSVAVGASVSIGAGQNIPVASLTLGGTPQAGGSTYGGIGSNAGTINSTYFDATTGTLSVGSSISFTGTLTAVDTTYGTASASTTFSVSGVNMAAGILVTPPLGYEVSLAPGSGYGATVTVGAAGTIASTPVYVRLAATTAVGSYSGNIVLSSTNALSRNVATVLSTVSKLSQTITFAPLADKILDDASFTLTATATSGLAVTFASSDTAVATVHPTTGVVTIVGPGTTTITASQAGNGNYNAATDVSQTLTILDSTTWTTGLTWTYGVPSATKNAIILGVFDTASSTGGGFTAKNLTVNSGGSLTIRSGTTVTVQNEVIKNTGGTLVVQNTGSLRQVNDAAPANSGSITYIRDTASVLGSDYTYWSSPVVGQQLNISPSYTSGLYYSYNDFAVPEDWKTESGSTVMLAGKGYIIRGASNNSPASIVTATFTGVPNNGPKSRAIGPAGTSVLLGNPYPSALDADAFLAANAGVLSGTIYFWTHSTALQLASNITDGSQGSGIYAYTSNDYATYNITGGVGIDPGSSTSPGSGSVTPNGYIAAGQGFFGTSVATGASVVFNNGMRVAANNNQFFKTKNSKEKTASTFEKHRVWLDLTNAKGAFKQMLVGYITDATNNYEDRFDGESFNANMYVDFYSINQNKKLVIQGRALPFDPNDEIPLGYQTTISGPLTISIDKTDGLLADQEVYLEDKLTNTVTNLKTGGYTFTTAAGTFNSRFVLRYTNKTLGVDDVALNDNGVKVYKTNGVLNINAGDAVIANVKVYDIQGKLIAEQKNSNATTVVIKDLKDTKQVLIVKVTSKDGEVTTKKVMN